MKVEQRIRKILNEKEIHIYLNDKCPTGSISFIDGENWVSYNINNSNGFENIVITFFHETLHLDPELDPYLFGERACFLEDLPKEKRIGIEYKIECLAEEAFYHHPNLVQEVIEKYFKNQL